ncbi:hypothetical protein BsWGS_23035 [Bradybaena similaris]
MQVLTEVILLTLDIKDEQDWKVHHWASGITRYVTDKRKDCTPLEYRLAENCSVLIRFVLHSKGLVDALASINIFQTFLQMVQYFNRAVRFLPSPHTTSLMGKLDPTVFRNETVLISYP